MISQFHASFNTTATWSEPSTVLNGLSGGQSEMFGHIFIDVLLNLLRLSKLSDVEGFLKLCLFL